MCIDGHQLWINKTLLLSCESREESIGPNQVPFIDSWIKQGESALPLFLQEDGDPLPLLHTCAALK